MDKKSLWQGLWRILLRSGKISLDLYKIMVPIIIGVKILQELDLIAWLALPLEPCMRLVGLPGEMGLVWATAMINTTYASMIVFVSLADQHTLTVAQVTVLCAMILVAHSLPVEIQIVRKAGPRAGFQLFLRVAGALLLGWLLARVYAWGGWLQDTNVVLWQPQPDQNGLLAWGLAQVQNLAMIFIIITVLNLTMSLLTAMGLTALCVRILSPVLRALGIGSEAGTLTIVGMVMGISYGGGLIMHEAHSGRVPEKDIFSSLSLMGLSHAVFEDTLLMAALGGHMSGLFWARLLFTLIAMILLVRIVIRLGDGFFYRYLFRPVEIRAT